MDHYKDPVLALKHISSSFSLLLLLSAVLEPTQPLSSALTCLGTMGTVWPASVGMSQALLRILISFSVRGQILLHVILMVPSAYDIWHAVRKGM